MRLGRRDDILWQSMFATDLTFEDKKKKPFILLT